MGDRKPKAYDIEMHFKWNNEARYVRVNVKECPVCPGIQIFVTACSVCGRFSPKDRPIFFQAARAASLTPVDMESSLEGINPRPATNAKVLALPIITKPNSDDGPEAS